MILLTATTDKISAITSSAANLAVHVSYLDMSQANPPVTQGDTSGRQNTAISSATTTDILGAPSASETRNAKTINIRNTHASLSNDVTVQFNQNGTLYELFKATVPAGSTLQYIEGVGWFIAGNTFLLDAKRVVSADSVHATAATFADVTDLQVSVEANKKYNFESHLYHISNATTTGAQFGVNGPSGTYRIGSIDVVLNSATAATMAAGNAGAVNTAAIVETTGAATEATAILSGYVATTAAGTFSIRATSEVTVAAGLTVKVGSWLRLWETPA